MKFPFLFPVILAAGISPLLAHAGPHHESGLPDFAAHIYLGLQIVALLALPVCAIAFFLRSAWRKKSHSLRRNDSNL